MRGQAFYLFIFFYYLFQTQNISFYLGMFKDHHNHLLTIWEPVLVDEENKNPEGPLPYITNTWVAVAAKRFGGRIA